MIDAESPNLLASVRAWFSGRPAVVFVSRSNRFLVGQGHLWVFGGGRVWNGLARFWDGSGMVI